MWTVVSRVVGLARVTVVAAVLGATYFGNTYQTANILPNLTYEFLTGSLFTSLLVPSLVGHVDRRDRRAIERIAGGFLGVALLGFAAVTAVAIAGGSLLLRLLSLGVDDPSVAAAQRTVGLPLIAMLMPQVLLYGVAATGGAVMNAHGRFALAAAAPAFESVGVILTMVVFAVVFGTAPGLGDVGSAELLLLGLGTTAAVGLHAGAQWWGARRVGVRLRPRAGWRDPEVRQIVRVARPSLGYAGLNSSRVFAMLMVANRVPGGVVAFRLAANFTQLPVAVWARPVAMAMLPELSRLHREGALRRFHTELNKGAALTLFLVVPATVAFVVLAWPLARAVSIGEMATGRGVALVAASLAALGVGILGDAVFVLASHASYARLDARAPLRAMVARSGVALGGILIAGLIVDGTAVLVTLGLAFSAGNLVGALQLARAVRAGLPHAEVQLAPTFLRAAVAAAVMAAPAYLVGTVLAGVIPSPARYVASLVLTSLVGMVLYVAVHAAWGTPELAMFRSGAVWRRTRRSRT
jgi:putative peptidoglycan lipid II flippase